MDIFKIFYFMSVAIEVLVSHVFIYSTVDLQKIFTFI